MAKTVDNFSTIEDFRKTYNELAFDVGEKDGLRDGLKLGTNGTLVDALNILEDKKFFLQEYTYIATNNQTTFTGNDNFSVKLLFKKDKVQVFKNERHLVEDVDYIVASPDGQGNHESIVLQGTYASGQSNAMSAGDRLTIYSYTGAFIGTQIAGTASSFFQKSAENTIYNTNANGVILNGDNSSATTTLESGFTLQLAGKTFAEDDIISSVSGKKVQFGNNVSKSINKTKRRFNANIVSKKFYIPEEDKWITLKVKASVLKTINKNGISAVLKRARENGQLK